MLHRLFLVVLLLVVPLAAPPAAAAEGEPAVDVHVWGELDLTQPNLTFLEVRGAFHVYRFVVDGHVYDADDLAQAYHGRNKHAGEPSGAAFVAELERAATEAFASNLAATFPYGLVSDLRATVDLSSLQRPGGDPLDPPARLEVSAGVLRTREALGFSVFSDEALATLFAAGGATRSDFTFSARPGYHVTYALGAPQNPPHLRFLPGPGVSADGSAIRVVVDNLDGSARTHELAAYVADATVDAPQAEDIRSVIDVTLGNVVPGQPGMPVTVDVRSEVRALDVGARFPGALPPKVALPYVNAEGLRALRAAGLLRDEDIARADQALVEAVRADIERAFGADASVTGGLVPEDLAAPAAAPYAADPPLRFLASASTTYVVASATPQEIDLALRVGGVASVALGLAPANGRDTLFTVRAPPSARFVEAEGGAVSSDGLVATFHAPAGAEPLRARLALAGRSVPLFHDLDAKVNVTIDLQDVDVRVAEAMGGDLGDLLVQVDVRAELGVILLPAELRASLPPSLELDHLSADAIRLLHQNGKLAEADIARLEAQLVEDLEARLGAAMGGRIEVEGAIDRATLSAALVRDPISADTPILFSATSRFLKPLDGGEVQPAAAIALYTTALPLSLPKLRDLDTQYTIILPRGLSVEDVAAPDGTSEVGTSADGRAMFVVRPTQESAPTEVILSMGVTPTFVLAKFWPIVLLAVVLVALAVGTPIALVKRKRALAARQAKK